MDSKVTRELELLTILHYVLSGILALFSLMPLMHVGMGLFFVFGNFENSSGGQPPPPAFGWFFVIVGSLCILTGFTIALLIFLSARNLKRCKSRMFCMVVAGLECMFMPLGTALGVFTIITLTKPEIKALFEGDGEG